MYPGGRQIPRPRLPRSGNMPSRSPRPSIAVDILRPPPNICAQAANAAGGGTWSPWRKGPGGQEQQRSLSRSWCTRSRAGNAHGPTPSTSSGTSGDRVPLDDSGLMARGQPPRKTAMRMLLNVVEEGEPLATTCNTQVRWHVYPLNQELRLADGDVVRNPGEDLVTMLRLLGGDIGERRDAHGCSYRFSLRPWRRRDPRAFKVLVIVGSTGHFDSWPTLALLRRRFGGDDGFFYDPFGNAHKVSLEDWKEEDPARFRFSPAFVREYRDGWWTRLMRRIEDKALAEEIARGTMR